MEIKTPGVYVVEKNAFPNAVVEVASAVPAFVGHTAVASHQGRSLRGVPWRITSMAEYTACFGGAPAPRFQLEAWPDGAAPPGDDMERPRGQQAVFDHGGRRYRLSRAAARTGGRYVLPQAMQHFFANGGGACHVVSVGGFDDELEAGDDRTGLVGGLAALLKEQEPTLVVVPDAVLLARSACAVVQQAMLAHCGATKSRVAVLDVWGGDRDRADAAGDCIAHFRAGLAAEHRSYACAYYPWLHTALVASSQMQPSMFDQPGALAALLKADMQLPAVATAQLDARSRALVALFDRLATPDPSSPDPLEAHKAALAASPLYALVIEQARALLNLMPPSPAMAGVMATVDAMRGVWKAPANVGLDSVVAPAVAVSNAQTDDLNLPLDGAAVNAIRSFVGRGVLVWGARTLDGHSQDARYLSVRRTLIVIEQSCALAMKALVFEPNVATTWATVRSMLENYLVGLWKRGGLQGATPDDAFAVRCGLGETLTAQDVLAGRLRASVLVALLRPAEFIVLTIEQQQAAA